MVQMEAIITELVFEHALRIRMKAELPPDVNPTTGESTVVATPDTGSVDESDDPVEGTGRHEDNANPSNSSDEATLAGSQAGALTGKSDPSKKKGGGVESALPKDASTTKPNPAPASSNMTGKLNNLVTSDLANITFGREFMLLGKHQNVPSLDSYSNLLFSCSMPFNDRCWDMVPL